MLDCSKAASSPAKERGEHTLSFKRVLTLQLTTKRNESISQMADKHKVDAQQAAARLSQVWQMKAMAGNSIQTSDDMETVRVTTTCSSD